MLQDSFKLSKPIIINKPEYVYLKLTPNKSIRNTQTGRILEFVAETYTNLLDRIKFGFINLTYTTRSKFAYYIYITKSNIEFYFIVREDYVDLLCQRISEVWKNLVTITTVESIPKFQKYNYYLDYKYENALSMRCDNRDNDLIGSILNTTNIMHEGDKVGLLFNFTPIYQKNWIMKYNQTMDKIKNDLPYYKNKISLLSVFCAVVDYADKFLNELINRKPQKKDYGFSLSEDTRGKKKKTVVSTQIVCAGNSNNAMVSLCEAFHIIDDDNSLVKHRKKRKMNFESYSMKCNKMLISTSEAQNFVSLPGDTLLKQYKIEHINIAEAKVPEELQHGYMRLGTNTFRGIDTKAFLMDDLQIGTLPVVMIGEQGSAKTTTLGNFAKDAQSRNEGVIIIDYINRTELCDAVKSAVDIKNVIDMDLSDVDNAQGIGYNELKPKSDKAKDIAECSNQKAQYISRLIDSIGNKSNNADDLSSRMDRYLSAASNVVMVDENASLKDVVKCLNDYKYRDICIKRLRKDVAAKMDEYISDLRELDEIDSKTGKVSSTKFSKIEGVNDRISKLRKDYRLKEMFNASCRYNIDLVDAMEKGKVVLFRMRQVDFPTSYSRNVMTTYLLTKIWAAGIVRGSMHEVPLRCHIIVDEPFQAHTMMDLINNEQIIPQTRKFQIQFLMTAQYKSQIAKIFESLHNAGASYMLMKGSAESHFDDFKDLIYPFTLDDMQSLKQFHSINIINTKDGRKVFETALPAPIKLKN